MRRLRVGVNHYMSGAVVLARNADLFISQFKAEGIGLGILNRGLKDLPKAGVMRDAVRRQTTEQKLDAWRQCRHSWGIKSARYLSEHGLRYHSHNPHHVLGLHRAMFSILGPVETVHDAQKKIKSALLAIGPQYDAQRGLTNLDEEASQGRQRLIDTLMSFREILQQPQYIAVLFHPEMHDWNVFSTPQQKAFIGVMMAIGIGALAYSTVLLTLVVSSFLALITNEMRLGLRDMCSEQMPVQSGLRPWLFATRYTGRFAF